MTVLQKVLSVRTFFFREFHQDDISSDLTDAAPWDDKFTFPSPETAESARSGNDQCCDLSASFIKFQIDRTAKTSAGADIYDLFLS